MGMLLAQEWQPNMVLEEQDVIALTGGFLQRDAKESSQAGALPLAKHGNGIVIEMTGLGGTWPFGDGEGVEPLLSATDAIMNPSQSGVARWQVPGMEEIEPIDIGNCLGDAE